MRSTCASLTQLREILLNNHATISHMKCEICNKTIAETFLKKIVGTVVKDEKGKKHNICFECQKKFQKKEELLENLK